MHEVDETTEQMVRSVPAYAENRLRMNPVPLDKGFLPAEELYERLDGLIRETPRQPDEVLGVYTSVIAPRLVMLPSIRYRIGPGVCPRYGRAVSPASRK
jgi:hypothetical protein